MSDQAEALRDFVTENGRMEYIAGTPVLKTTYRDKKTGHIVADGIPYDSPENEEDYQQRLAWYRTSQELRVKG